MQTKLKSRKPDTVVKAIKAALARYASDHPGAKFDLYRRNPASVRVRVIDASFRNLNRASRHEQVWSYLDGLDKEVLADVSWLLLLSPDEASSSLSSEEFEDPAP